MPPRRQSLSIRTPVNSSSSSASTAYSTAQQYNSDEYASEQQTLNTLRAQYARYKGDADWTGNNRNERDYEGKYFKRQITKLENRRPLCKKVTNAITGAVRSICGFRRQRTRKVKQQRNCTRRVR